MRFPIGVGNDCCYEVGNDCGYVVRNECCYVVGNDDCFEGGAEITMHLPLGMMFLISEVLLVGKFRLRISLNKRCILLVQS